MANSTQDSNIQNYLENAARETQDSQKSTNENKDTNNKSEDTTNEKKETNMDEDMKTLRPQDDETTKNIEITNKDEHAIDENIETNSKDEDDNKVEDTMETSEMNTVGDVKNDTINKKKETNKDEEAMETTEIDIESEEEDDKISKESDVEKMDVDEEPATEQDEARSENDINVPVIQKQSGSNEIESKDVEKEDAKDDDYNKENKGRNDDGISRKPIEEEDRQKDDITEEESFVESTESNKVNINEYDENLDNQTKQDLYVTEKNKDSNTEDVQSNVSVESNDSNAMEISNDKETNIEDKEPCVGIRENEEHSHANNENEDKIEEQSNENKIIADKSEEHSDENKKNEDKSQDCTDENKENENNRVEHYDENKERQNENTDKDDEQTNTDNMDKESAKNEGALSEDVTNETISEELPTLSKEKDNIPNEQDLNNKNNDNSDNGTMNDEHSIFVQVTNEKDDTEKSTAITEQVCNDVDPIGSSDWSQNNENNENTFISDLDEADECIIPDTNRDESMLIDIDSSKEPDITLNSASQAATTSTESDRMKLSEKYLVSVANAEEESDCMICNEKKNCKYSCTKDEDKTSLCSEDCLAKLKEKHTENVIVRQLRVKNFSLDKNLQASDSGHTSENAKTTCKNCFSVITDAGNSLSWEALDFCNEQCLTKHQKLIGSYCANCRIEVKENFLGKYCVRFGYNVRQFCSGTCLEQYKKNSKVCSYCQDDISGNTSGFLTSIGDKGMSKDFCSAQCMQKYNEISKHLKGGKIYDKCCVCHKQNVIEIEFDFKDKDVLFCGEPCFVAFKYVNDVNPEKCDMCCKYYMSKATGTNYIMRYDGVFRKFCQKTCQNIYITTNRKIVSCCWCKVKKYNFDMIQKYSPDSSVLIVCSLTCLFFNASINVSKIKRKRCDFCHKMCKGQYHITLADDSMKNFCSYPCVQEYQTKYILAPARFTEQPVAISSTANVRVTRKNSGVQHTQRKQIIPDVPGPLPIITSVRSLAPTANSSPNTRSLRSKSSTPNTITTITSLQTESPPVRRIIVLRPPDLAQQRNVATLVKPITADVAVEFKPVMVDKAVQTEDLKDSLVLVPIPVPIYVPSPMQMFNLLYPKPVPFPLPIPVPMFIPITKQTSNVVLKEIKKNQKSTPTDPYEADLLMMAELVAGENEKKENIAESEADADSDGDNVAEPSFSPEPQDGSNTFGDDMLQMALKMASDFEEPAVDLEGALTASTITATSAPNEQVEDVPPIQPPIERTTFRGRRRGRPPRHGGRGRGRGRPPTQPEIIVPVEPEPQPPPEPVEKPDANMCLKYTFGVNAWKQWVTTKNAELEKSSRPAKPFKPDLLQLTSDELNYSLCLFVKEVRKPNGAEYAPDTIYYLCLGIQQYLFENGRIDNIFCDSYYESFTECLDEVCRKFSTLYNDSQYIVTRVEEEHLWESKQLGAHSPHVLLSTLMFFNTKHFNLTNVEEHMQLSFSHIMKHWKRVPNQAGTPKNSSSRNILLRFYPPQSAVEGNNRKKKVYEQQENEENPLRCPVKLYEFYLSKCPESVKTRNDVFYLLPERSCVPDSPVWYSTMALGKDALEKMLHRVKMVKEINVALLAS